MLLVCSPRGGTSRTLQEYLPKTPAQPLSSFPCCETQLEEEQVQQPFTGEGPGSGTAQRFIIKVFRSGSDQGGGTADSDAVWHPVTLLYRGTQRSIGTCWQVQSSPTVTFLIFSLALTRHLDHQPVRFQPCVLPCRSHQAPSRGDSMKMSSREGRASFNSGLCFYGPHAQNLVILSQCHKLLTKGHVSAELQLSCGSAGLKN